MFTGWAESKTGKGRTYADKEPFAEVTIYQGNKIEDGGTITLYAQWKKLPDVTISYTPEPTSLGTVKLNPTESNELGPQDGMVSESLNPRPAWRKAQRLCREKAVCLSAGTMRRGSIP